MADFVKNDKRNNNNGKKNFNRPNNRPDNKSTGYTGGKKRETIPAPDVCAGTVEYKMSKTMADEIIKASKSKRRPQEILCDYVNTQCGLQGYCVKVLVDLQ